jgi:uncharacterized protein
MVNGLLNEIWVLFLEMSPYMLLGMAFVALLNLLVTKDLIIRHVGSDSIMSVIKASLFGVPLPLCSCGVVPTAVYMAKNGASRASVVSFLISTPQTGIDSIIATYGMMGWLFAIYRPIMAFFMGISGGIATSIFNKEKTKPEEYIFKEIENTPKLPLKRRIINTLNYAFIEFFDDISVHFIIGLIIAGFIAFFLPADTIAEAGIQSGILGMLLMIAIGAPMYICATASIPIAVALMMKGFSPGVAFVFLAVGPATNAASLAVLAEAIGKKTTAIYVISMSITAIISGLILDWIFELFNIDMKTMLQHMQEHGGIISYEIKLILGIIFFILLAVSVYRVTKAKFDSKKESIMDKNTAEKMNIEGMTCPNCVTHVKRAIAATDGVTSVDVNLEDNAAYIEGEFDTDKVKAAVVDAGYKVK